jgi:hypothetical protein
MPLIKIKLQPGIQNDGTRYSSSGGWSDGEKVRFRQGDPEKIGGWQKSTLTPFLGTARSMHPWSDLQGSAYLGIGTNLKYYIEDGGALSDITPIREEVSLTDPFSTTTGSSVVTITDSAHSAIQGDFVSFSPSRVVGGITISGEYQILAVPDGNTYTINGGSNASSTVASGGSSVTASYQINTGLNATVYGNGWGAGGWGGVTGGSPTTGWGQSSPLTASGARLRLWSQDSFGEDLIINVRDGGIYYWDASSGLSVRAVSLSTLPGANGIPPRCRQIIVSESDRKLLAFGCTDLISGIQDALLIRWSSTEDVADFTPTESNTAGGFRIPTGSEFITAVETKQEILVWSDMAIHSMRYIGPPFQYGITRIGLTTIVGPNATAAANDAVFWMGQNGFFFYDGRVNPLLCPVKDHVFLDFNWSQADKVVGGTNMSFNEVWWFYPSASSSEVDRYVAFNYAEQLWHIGTLSRTAWVDRSIEDYPRAAGLDGYIYFHEYGSNDGSTNPPSPIVAYIESGPIEIQQGDQFGFAWRLIPDVSFRNSSGVSPSVNMILRGDDFPGADWATGQTKNNNVNLSVLVPIQLFTEQTYFRLRARSVTLRIESTTVDVAWRLGIPRIDVKADGRR